MSALERASSGNLIIEGTLKSITDVVEEIGKRWENHHWTHEEEQTGQAVFLARWTNETLDFVNAFVPTLSRLIPKPGAHEPPSYVFDRQVYDRTYNFFSSALNMAGPGREFSEPRQLVSSLILRSFFFAPCC